MTDAPPPFVGLATGTPVATTQPELFAAQLHHHGVAIWDFAAACQNDGAVRAEDADRGGKRLLAALDAGFRRTLAVDLPEFLPHATETMTLLDYSTDRRGDINVASSFHNLYARGVRALATSSLYTPFDYYTANLFSSPHAWLDTEHAQRHGWQAPNLLTFPERLCVTRASHPSSLTTADYVETRPTAQPSPSNHDTHLAGYLVVAGSTHFVCLSGSHLQPAASAASLADETLSNRLSLVVTAGQLLVYHTNVWRAEVHGSDQTPPLPQDDNDDIIQTDANKAAAAALLVRLAWCLTQQLPVRSGATASLMMNADSIGRRGMSPDDAMERVVHNLQTCLSLQSVPESSPGVLFAPLFDASTNHGDTNYLDRVVQFAARLQPELVESSSGLPIAIAPPLYKLRQLGPLYLPYHWEAELYQPAPLHRLPASQSTRAVCAFFEVNLESTPATATDGLAGLLPVNTRAPDLWPHQLIRTVAAVGRVADQVAIGRAHGLAVRLRRRLAPAYQTPKRPRAVGLPLPPPPPPPPPFAAAPLVPDPTTPTMEDTLAEPDVYTTPSVAEFYMEDDIDNDPRPARRASRELRFTDRNNNNDDDGDDDGLFADEGMMRRWSLQNHHQDDQPSIDPMLLLMRRKAQAIKAAW